MSQIFTVLLSTSVFVGGALAVILDNTVPGTDEERGIISWNKQSIKTGNTSDPTYNLPLGSNAIRRWKWTRYIPLCPTFDLCGTNDVDCEEVETEQNVQA